MLYQLEGVKERGLTATIVTKTDFSVSTAALLTHNCPFHFWSFLPFSDVATKEQETLCFARPELQDDFSDCHLATVDFPLLSPQLYKSTIPLPLPLKGFPRFQPPAFSSSFFFSCRRQRLGGNYALSLL